MKTQRFPSRGARGRQLIQKVAGVGGGETAMKGFPWKNPLKGGIENVAMAEVTMKGAGLFVGFRVKF